MVNWHILSAILAGCFSFSIGLFVYLKNKKSHLNRAFFIFNIVIPIWNFADYFIIKSHSDTEALFWDRISYIGAFFIPLFCANVIFEFMGKHEHYKKLYRLARYVIAILLIIDFTPLFLKGVTRIPFEEDTGPLFVIFVVYFVVTVFYSLYVLYRYYTRENISPSKKLEMKYVFSGILVAMIGVLCYFLTLTTPTIPPVHYFIEMLYLVIFAYAIVEFHLMDIRIAIARGVIFVFVYAFVLGIPFLFSTTGLAFLIRTLGVHWLTYYTFFSLFLASGGPIIYNIIRTKTENKLLEKQHAYQEYITTMAQGIVLYRDKHEVSNAVREMLITNMEVERVLLFYLDRRAKEFISLEGKGEEQIHISWVDHSTTILLERWKEPIMNEELARSGVKRHMQVQDTEALLKQANAVMFVPCIAGEEVVGFISVGQKKDKTIFTMDDIRVLKLLASEAALALKNVEFYQEMRDNEMRLIQTAKLTSLGEIAAGFAHQINNPLQVITGAKQLLEHGIAEYSAQISQYSIPEATQKEMTDFFDVNLERIDSMSQRIKDIINSIRRYTEKTDYTQEEVKKLVQNGLAMIPESKLKLAHVKVVQNIPENIPTVSVKAIDIEQVVMNLCTNAIEAMEEQGEGIITIDAREADEKGYVAIVISDTGCGIPEEIRERIFDPFFTTKGAQGTGLGLSVVHTIIKDNQGQITCKSSRNKGTTFTVLLPIVRTQNQGGTNDERTREEREEKGADH